jgi:lysyl-tRNA synthetase class I
LCYGINRGYAAFSNKYKFQSKEKIVKFQLNSLLDYYTIESVYQYAYNEIDKSNSFPYLEEWCSKLNLKATANTYKVLDQIVVEKRARAGENIQKETASDLKHKEKTVVQYATEASPKSVVMEESYHSEEFHLREENRQLKELLKQIKKQKNAKKIKELITDYENKPTIEITLFDQQGNPDK